MPLFASKHDRAIAACAKALPARLAHDYGASEFYTEGQITRALAALKIATLACPYAYATYLSEDAYLRFACELPTAPNYVLVHLAFAAHRPPAPRQKQVLLKAAADLAEPAYQTAAFNRSTIRPHNSSQS